MSGSSLSLRNLGATAPSAPTSTAGTSSLTTILIYESVIAFLKRSCNIRILGRSRDEADRLQSTLDGYMQSMLSESLVDAIVDSLGYRKILLELSSELGFAADPNLRIALREDEERIAAVLVFILHSKSAERAALSLEGSAAQSFLDVVQDTLDRGFLMTQDHSWKARRIIRKLSESCDKLPSSLFITGVNGRDEHPMFGGGFGDIYRASYENQTVALKSMRHFLRGGELRRVRWEFCREALVWKDLHHPHILTFLGIDRESFPSTLCMVSPWMEHGTVLTYLHDHGHANVDKLLFEIAQGLQYLHSHNVVHGDLRGANILINQDWSACLADFGLSVFSDATTHTSNRAGSIYWMSPELIAPERFGYRFARTPASDVYAFGCVCIELYTGRPPFSELSEAAALLSIINGERPRRPSGTPAMSDSLWRHLTAYWQHNPTARPVTELVVQNMVWPALNREPTPVQTRTHRSTDPPTYIIYPDNQLDGLQPQTYREESPYTQPPSLWDGSVDYQSRTRDRGSGSRSSSETRDLPAASITIQPEDSRSWHSRSRSLSPEGQIIIQPPYSEAASDGTYYPTASDPTYYPEPYYYPSAPLPGMYPQPPATRKNPLLALFRPLLQAMKRNDSKSNSAPIYNPYSHYPPPQTVIVQPSWPPPEQMPLGYYAPPTIPMSPYYSPTQMPAYYGAPAPIIITSRSSSSSRSRSRSSSPSRLPGMTDARIQVLASSQVPDSTFSNYATQPIYFVGCFSFSFAFSFDFNFSSSNRK
ncbi:kinase-like domain-containing protein [Mycena crocata]|nr:kinase-like domain-containing protein [Mycena crocata]